MCVIYVQTKKSVFADLVVCVCEGWLERQMSSSLLLIIPVFGRDVDVVSLLLELG